MDTLSTLYISLSKAGGRVGEVEVEERLDSTNMLGSTQIAGQYSGEDTPQEVLQMPPIEGFPADRE